MRADAAWNWISAGIFYNDSGICNDLLRGRNTSYVITRSVHYRGGNLLT